MKRLEKEATSSLVWPNDMVVETQLHLTATGERHCSGMKSRMEHKDFVENEK